MCRRAMCLSAALFDFKQRRPLQHGNAVTTLLFLAVWVKLPGIRQPLAQSFGGALPNFPGWGTTSTDAVYHPARRTRVVRTTAYTHFGATIWPTVPRNAVGTALKTRLPSSAAAGWSVYRFGDYFPHQGPAPTFTLLMITEAPGRHRNH